MNIITTDNLCREFKTGGAIVHALKGINIHIERGRMTILNGRSGSGKTTLINLLSALDRPTSGKIYYQGREIAGMPGPKRDRLRQGRIGLVYQSIALLPMLSAYENVEFRLKISKYDPKARKKRAVECLRMVGLEERMDHMPAEMSGGEQQRVAIARAVSSHPDILFADEPTAQLDTHTGIKIVQIFKRLVEAEGMSVLMTTHDPAMLEIADTVITLQDGEVAG
jgi:putative ABC transport system ATP-binding protein